MSFGDRVHLEAFSGTFTLREKDVEAILKAYFEEIGYHPQSVGFSYDRGYGALDRGNGLTATVHMKESVGKDSKGN